MKLKASQFIALFLLMLVSGVFWGTWFSLSRSMEVFSAGEFIHIGKTIIANLAVPMRIIMPLCIVFVFLCLVFYPKRRSVAFYFNAIAFILVLCALLITLLIEVPIDNQVREWTETTVPANWEKIRDWWEFFHTLRTFISLTGFGCLTVSVLLPHEKGPV